MTILLVLWNAVSSSSHLVSSFSRRNTFSMRRETVVSERPTLRSFFQLMNSSMQAWRKAWVYCGLSPVARRTKMVVLGETLTERETGWGARSGFWAETRAWAITRNT